MRKLDLIAKLFNMKGENGEDNPDIAAIEFIMIDGVERIIARQAINMYNCPVCGTKLKAYGCPNFCFKRT